MNFVRALVNAHQHEIIVSLVVMVITIVTGNLSNWSAGDITFTVVILIAVALWGYYGFLRIQWWRYRPADYEKWNRVPMPTLWQAACIYDDIEPYRPIREGTPCYPTLQMLKSEHMNGSLSFETEDEDGWQRIRIEELRKLAERLGDKPKCLFPDETPESP